MGRDDPASTPDMAHLWLEQCRRQLGRPRLTDDEFEELRRQVLAGDDRQLTLDDDDDPEF